MDIGSTRNAGRVLTESRSATAGEGGCAASPAAGTGKSRGEGENLMGKLLRGPRRLYALLGMLSAATAVGVGLAVSMGGAADQPSSEFTVNAKHVSAK